MRRQPEPLEGDEVKEAKLESSLELLLQKLVLIICCFTWDWHFKGLVLLCSFFHTGTGDHGTWIVYEYMLSVLVYMKCFKCTVDFIERFLVEQFFAGKCSLYSIEKSPGNACHNGDGNGAGRSVCTEAVALPDPLSANWVGDRLKEISSCDLPKWSFSSISLIFLWNMLQFDFSYMIIWRFFFTFQL